MKNEQSPESIDQSTGEFLAVNEIFFTIQGEGPFAGQRAVFIRLAGCNLQCPKCDTEYSSRVTRSVDAIIDKTRELHKERPRRHPHPLVVITGGEPFRQPIYRLVKHLLNTGMTVQIETNGTLHRELPYSNSRLHVVCSPKTGNVNPLLLPHIKAFKYVLTAGDVAKTDGLPIKVLDHPARMVFRKPIDHPAQIYVQPADARNGHDNYENQNAAVRSAMDFGYTLCLQLHKIVHLP